MFIFFISFLILSTFCPFPTTMARFIQSPKGVLDESDFKGWYCADQTVHFNDGAEGLEIEDGQIVFNMLTCDQPHTDVNFLMPVPEDFAEEEGEFPFRDLEFEQTEHIQLRGRHSVEEVLKGGVESGFTVGLCTPAGREADLPEANIPLGCRARVDKVESDEPAKWVRIPEHCWTECAQGCTPNEEWFPRKLSSSINARLGARQMAYVHDYQKASTVCENSTIVNGVRRLGCPLGEEEGASVKWTYPKEYKLLVHIDDLEEGQEGSLRDCLGSNGGEGSSTSPITTTTGPVKRRWRMPTGKLAGFLDKED